MRKLLQKKMSLTNKQVRIMRNLLKNSLLRSQNQIGLLTLTNFNGLLGL